MSSSAGLSSYSSLFASGLHSSSQRDPDVYAYPFQPSNTSFSDFPANVDARRPSAADTISSRRSSLPTTFASDRRMGQNNSYYPPRALQDSNAFAFTPSILLRSDTNATKRSNYKSFLSMDANDPTAIPPPLPNLHNITTVTSSSQPQSTFSKRPRHTRAVSVSSSTWAPSMLQSPDHTHHSGKGGRQDLMTAGTPSTSEAASHSTRRSISVPARDDRQSTKSSDTPPRLDITLDPKLSRISFDPLAHEAASGRLAAALVSGVSGVSTTPTIPARPEYEPRVRSSLPPSSAASTFPPVPPRSVKRNMSVTSATTFASATPSQRSAIRRVRRNEALARLEGTHYDPAPASASFMPFGSDEEEEESEVDRSSSSHHHRDTISSSSAKSPPPIKPPSPLRYRNPEQRRFVEIDPPESLFELALSTIAEAPPTPQPAPQPAPPQPVQQTRAPSIHVHQSLWPALEDEDEENASPFVSSYHNRQPSRQPTPYIHTPSRTPNAISPFSSRSNLTMHTSNNHSSTSLASFTPFSSTDYNRATTRPGSIHKSHTSKNTNAHAANGSTHSHSQSNSPYGRMTPAGSGPASSRSVSLRSNDLSDEYEYVGENESSVDSHAYPHPAHPGHHTRHASSRRDRDRSGTVSAANNPHYLKASAAMSLGQHQGQTLSRQAAAADVSVPRNDAWLRESLTLMAPVPLHNNNKSTKSKEKDAKSTKEGKNKEGKIRYETYLDMSGDEKGAMKKRRWLFGK